MTNGSSDRLDRIEALLQRSIIASDERLKFHLQMQKSKRTPIHQNLSCLKQALLSAQRLSISQAFSGPLPPPAILKTYELVQEGLASKIVDQADARLNTAWSWKN